MDAGLVERLGLFDYLRRRLAIAGTPEDCVEQARAAIAAGATRLMFTVSRAAARDDAISSTPSARTNSTNIRIDNTRMAVWTPAGCAEIQPPHESGGVSRTSQS